MLSKFIAWWKKRSRRKRCWKDFNRLGPCDQRHFKLLGIDPESKIKRGEL